MITKTPVRGIISAYRGLFLIETFNVCLIHPSLCCYGDITAVGTCRLTAVVVGPVGKVFTSRRILDDQLAAALACPTDRLGDALAERAAIHRLHLLQREYILYCQYSQNQRDHIQLYRRFPHKQMRNHRRKKHRRPSRPEWLFRFSQFD